LDLIIIREFNENSKSGLGSKIGLLFVRRIDLVFKNSMEGPPKYYYRVPPKTTH
jgi:hypothetical protein